MRSSRARAAILAAIPPLFVFALNVWICWRLFRSEYIDQMQSIEGSFISMAAYIERHWSLYNWFPEWYGGMPFVRTYPPGLHYAVALMAKMFGLSPASAYHFITATTYSLGGVTFYYLVRVLGGDRVTAFLGALVFSVFSPSTLLIPAVRSDAGGLLNARRLQALVTYGEGPNVTGLTIAMLAFALVHRALRKRTPGSCLLAALALAAVPIVNWTATIGLVIGLAAYLAATEWREIVGNLPRLALIGAITAAIAFPLELPSTIRSTFFDAIGMDAGQGRGAGAGRIASVLILLALLLIRAVLIRLRAGFGLRFSVLYFVLVGGVVLGAYFANVRLVPLPERFHIAMEIPLTLAAAFAMAALCRTWPRCRIPVVLVLVICCAAQAVHYRKYARTLVRKIDIATTVEFQEARWMDRNMNGERVMVPGSISFWANAFTDTPQMTGCCLQSLNSVEPLIASYVLSAGFGGDRESADYSLLWLKAHAVQAIAMDGRNSREYYKDFKHPDEFRGLLPVMWSSGDDYIYRVPERTASLARVVASGDLVHHLPASGIDVTELRPFVSALDDPSLPVASFAWTDVNTARIAGVLSPGQALSIAVAWYPGWSATANGRPVPVRADGLGFISLEPNCSGSCDVMLHWSPGSEPAITIAITLLTLIAMAIWSFVARAGSTPESSG